MLVFVNSTSITCQWSQNGCNNNYDFFFAVHGDYSQEYPIANDSRPLSSNSAIANDSNFNVSLCCNTGLSETGFNVTIINLTESPVQECSENQDSIMYFTDYLNARVGFSNSSLFNISHYRYKYCAGMTDLTYSVDIRVVDRQELNRLRPLGYTCLYKINKEVNGHISHCRSTFNNTPNNYDYSVIARLWHTMNELSCTQDCTSRFDNRVYSSCGQFLDVCTDISPSCDGALYGSWVRDIYDSNKDVRCSFPWYETRTRLFTDERVEVTSSDVCSSLISSEHQVIIDNEIVTMKIYTCES